MTNKQQPTSNNARTAQATEIETLANNLAQNLKYLRERSGLTQSKLGKVAEVPRSTLANLESGCGNPTLSVLARLAGALSISLEELITPPRGMGKLYAAGSLPSERKGSRDEVIVNRLLPDPIAGMEILRMEFAPGASFVGAPHKPGTREYLFCESGRLNLHAAGERFELSPGDVCAFHGDQSHSYTNPGEQTTVALAVVVVATL